MSSRYGNVSGSGTTQLLQDRRNSVSIAAVVVRSIAVVYRQISRLFDVVKRPATSDGRSNWLHGCSNELAVPLASLIWIIFLLHLKMMEYGSWTNASFCLILFMLCFACQTPWHHAHILHWFQGWVISRLTVNKLLFVDGQNHPSCLKYGASDKIFQLWSHPLQLIRVCEQWFCNYIMCSDEVWRHLLRRKRMAEPCRSSA